MAKQKSGEKKPAQTKRSMNLSAAEKKRRSEAAKQRVEAGKMGGAEFGKLGGRPRKKRASEVVAEEAQKQGEQIAKVFKDGIADNGINSIPTRLKAAEAFLGVEQKEAKLQMEEDEHYNRMGKEELHDHLAAKLKENPLLADIFRKMLAGEDLTPQNGNGHGPAEEIDIPEADVVED